MLRNVTALFLGITNATSFVKNAGATMPIWTYWTVNASCGGGGPSQSTGRCMGRADAVPEALGVLARCRVVDVLGFDADGRRHGDGAARTQPR